MTVEADEWLQRFAAKLGIDPPSHDEQNLLLGLAGVAAHASERTAAPISCWLASRAGVSLVEASAAARELAAELETEP